MSSEKKINIIGAGISGLAAGCYLQMNGFKTEIFESHSKPGGLCTSWQKGEYTFDGCLHWLLGSGKGSPFNKMWTELLDLSKIEFVNHSVRADNELLINKDKYGDNVFHLYTNINKFENYLMDISPEDEKIIKKLTSLMRQIQKYDVPPVIDDLPFFKGLKQNAKLIKLLPFLFLMLKWKNVTNFSFARKFKSPFLKEAFELFFDGKDMPLLIIFFPLAFFDKNGAGYPVGGSLSFAKKIEERYLGLGGKINYNCPVKKIITENNTAKGLELNNGALKYSDITISSADWHFTVFKALNGKFANKKLIELDNLRRNELFYSIIQISFGLNRTFEDFPHFFRFPLNFQLKSPDGTIYKRLEIHIFKYDPTLAPKGKTVVSLSFNTMRGDFWIDLRNSDYTKYQELKKVFASEVIDLIEQKISGFKNKIEETDIATPATHFRYTNNRNGSTQGWMSGKSLMTPSPVGYTLPGLKNFYLSGHWTMPGGGLPIAIKSSRDIAQIICKKNNMRFKVFKS
jgi:phytoene dehydrogenase-like protein